DMVQRLDSGVSRAVDLHCIFGPRSDRGATWGRRGEGHGQQTRTREPGDPMFRLTLDNVLAHRRRLISTFLAVVLGIAFLSGTLVMGDTIKSAFNHLMATVNSGTDAYVRRVAISTDGERGPFGQGQRGELDDSLVEAVRR